MEKIYAKCVIFGILSKKKKKNENKQTKKTKATKSYKGIIPEKLTGIK